MNNRKRMYLTNGKIKKYLFEQGFHSLYLFPHLRHIKDYILDGQGFDAIGWKSNEKRLFLFQFKTNEKPSKATLEEYHIINKKYYVNCVWINYVKRKGVEVYE